MHGSIINHLCFKIKTTDIQTIEFHQKNHSNVDVFGNIRLKWFNKPVFSSVLTRESTAEVPLPPAALRRRGGRRRGGGHGHGHLAADGLRGTGTGAWQRRKQTKKDELKNGWEKLGQILENDVGFFLRNMLENMWSGDEDWWLVVSFCTVDPPKWTLSVGKLFIWIGGLLKNLRRLRVVFRTNITCQNYTCPAKH